MNIITAQLTSLSPLLSVVQKAHTFKTKRSVLNLLEMIEFNEAFLMGEEIVLK